jgi:hypothetical protein
VKDALRFLLGFRKLIVKGEILCIKLRRPIFRKPNAGSRRPP